VSLLYLLQTCGRSILRNKMRSLLTSLGIIIGVASVVIMTAIGQGTQNDIEARISSMGTNLLQIGSQRMIFRAGQTSFARPGRISVKDKEKIAAENSFATAVSGLSQRNFTCVGTEGSASIQVMGVEPPYLQIRGWNIEEGAMFGDEENAERQRVAVLGSATAESLFGGTVEALGQTMRLGDGPWIIVGILEAHSDAGGMQNSDDLVLVPLRTYLTRLAPSSYLSTIMVSVVDKVYMDAAQRELEAIMREAHNLPDYSASDFSIMNSASLIEMASETSRSLTVLLAAIAGVSLLVGGIGIMNIMLVSVTERTREIGIMKVIGATLSDIKRLFLLESSLIGFIGGCIGVLLSIGASKALNTYGMRMFSSINEFSMQSTVSLVTAQLCGIATICATFIGLAAGYFPADRATKLSALSAINPNS